MGLQTVCRQKGDKLHVLHGSDGWLPVQSSDWEHRLSKNGKVQSQFVLTLANGCRYKAIFRSVDDYIRGSFDVTCLYWGAK